MEEILDIRSVLDEAKEGLFQLQAMDQSLCAPLEVAVGSGAAAGAGAGAAAAPASRSSSSPLAIDSKGENGLSVVVVLSFCDFVILSFSLSFAPAQSLSPPLFTPVSRPPSPVPTATKRLESRVALLNEENERAMAQNVNLLAELESISKLNAELRNERAALAMQLQRLQRKA